MVVKYLIDNELIYQSSDNIRFIKGTRISYAMVSPNQIKNNNLSIKALAKLNLSINDYEQIWLNCLLPTPDVSAKLEKSTINHINLHLNDYISIIHRLGDANDPIAQEILKPGLRNGQIGIDFDSNTFSLASEYIIHFNDDDDIMKQLNVLCIRATGQKGSLLNNTGYSMIGNYCLNAKMSGVIETFIPAVDNYNQLQMERVSSIISTDTYANAYDQTNTLEKQVISTEASKFHCILNYTFINRFECTSITANVTLVTSNIDSNSIHDCVFVLETIKTSKTFEYHKKDKVRYSPFSSRK
jgi:hypothetical protein